MAQLVAGSSPWRSGFNPRQANEVLVMNKASDHIDFMKRVFLLVLQISTSLQPHECPTAITGISLWGSTP